MVPGTTLLALFMAGGRTSAFLGWFPFYLAELLVIGAVLSVLRRLRHSGRLIERPLEVIAGSGSLFLLALIRVLDPEVPWALLVRDIAPYVYSLLMPLVAIGVWSASERELALTFRVLRTALNLHGIYVLLAIVLQRFFGIDVSDVWSPLSPRADISSALIAGAIALNLTRLHFDRRHALLHFLAIGIFSVVLISLDSRAGLLAAAISLAIVIWILICATDAWREVLTGGLVILVSFLLGWALNPRVSTDWLGVLYAFTREETSEVSRLDFSDPIATVAPSDTSMEARSSSGPVKARISLYGAVFRWISGQPSPFLGYGIGTNKFSELGFEAELVGQGSSENTRYPHNFLLTVFLQTGVPGVVVLSVLVAIVLFTPKAIGSFAPALQSDFLSGFGLFLALCLVSLVGVVWESPFGYIPFWGVAGLLVGMVARTKRTLNASPTTMRDL